MTSRGDAKLLDFGLAKQLHLDSVPTGDTPTFSGPITARGQIVGTIAYMSPEQVQDKATDFRSDIFSFGAVLYEMATGRCAFAGESAASVIAEILRGEPKSAKVLNPAIPDELQRVIGKALEKDPSDRYQSANDLMIDLRRLKRHTTGSSPARKDGRGVFHALQLAAQEIVLDIGHWCPGSPRVSDRRKCTLARFRPAEFGTNYFFFRAKGWSAGHGWNSALFSESTSPSRNVGQGRPDRSAASVRFWNADAGHFS